MYVLGVVYDTTASNTGIWRGAVGILERLMKRAILKLPCRRHVIELVPKRVLTVVTGKGSSSPGDELFERFRSNWNTIKPNLDYTTLGDQLNRFDNDKHQTTPYGAMVAGVTAWAAAAASTSFNSRSDYQQALYMICFYLGLPMPADTKYRFPRPIAVSNARFLQRCIYFLQMHLLMNVDEVADLFTDEEKLTIATMADFSAIIYGPHFLKCPFTTRCVFIIIIIIIIIIFIIGFTL
jgi:hypothetical protein